MAKQKRKLIEKLLFEVYDKGLQQNDCNLTYYYEKILQALNIPLVVQQSEQLFCYHEGSYTLNEDGTCCKCHRLPKPKAK